MRVLRSLAAKQPILGTALPHEQARLLVYSWQVGYREKIREEGLLEAAEKTLDRVQQELRTHRCGTRLDVAAAFELANARGWALHALEHLRGKQGAKAAEMRLADGQPLALCGVPTQLSIGFRKSKTIETVYGPVRLPNSGCFSVYEDSLQSDRGHMWSYYCRPCKSRNSKATRYQAERHAAQIVSVLRRGLRPPRS